VDRITEQKAKYLEERGYTITGYVLTNGTNGNRAFIDQGRVIWHEQEKAEVILGHALTKDPVESNIETQPEKDGFRQRTVAWLLKYRVIASDHQD
jgi:hypothetical protein